MKIFQLWFKSHFHVKLMNNSSHVVIPFPLCPGSIEMIDSPLHHRAVSSKKPYYPSHRQTHYFKLALITANQEGGRILYK